MMTLSRKTSAISPPHPHVCRMGAVGEGPGSTLGGEKQWYRPEQHQLHISHCRIRWGGQWEKALGLLREMKGRDGLDLDDLVFSTAVAECFNSREFGQAVKLLEGWEEESDFNCTGGKVEEAEIGQVGSVRIPRSCLVSASCGWTVEEARIGGSEWRASRVLRHHCGHREGFRSSPEGGSEFSLAAVVPMFQGLKATAVNSSSQVSP